MSRYTLLTIGIVLTVTSLSSGERPSWDKYRILVDRNIFVRDRNRPRRKWTPPPPRKPAPPVNPDKYLILTGIAGSEGNYIAFIEDTRSKRTFGVREGDSAGRGTISKITLDNVSYLCDGKTETVDMGLSLAGSAGSYLPRRESDDSSRSSDKTAPAEKTPESSPASQPAEEPPSERENTTRENMSPSSILERMRKRREQELNK